MNVDESFKSTMTRDFMVLSQSPYPGKPEMFVENKVAQPPEPHKVVEAGASLNRSGLAADAPEKPDIVI